MPTPAYNKLLKVIDAIETKMDALVTAGTLKRFHRRQINWGEEHDVPVAGVYIDSMHRETTTWIAKAVVQLITVTGATHPHDADVLLATAVCAAIEAVNGTGAGGVIDQPLVEFWYSPFIKDQPRQFLGAQYPLRIRCQDPLTVPAVP